MSDNVVDETNETDWAGEETAGPTYPEVHPNPHNHIYTVSMNGQGPMIVVRGNTPAEVNERFQALMDGGVTTVAASVYSHMKAEMGVASGLGPVSPAPAGPPMPPQGAVPPPFGPNVSVPAAPGYQGPPGMPQAPMPPAPPQGQWSGQAGGQQANSRGPKERPAWPQVYKIDVPFPAKDAFKAYREQYKDHFKGKIQWAGGGGYWIHGDIVQAMGQYNPVPA